METWLEYLERPELEKPTAIAASPGLRSVGWIAVEYLIRKLKPQLFAYIYSSHFPYIYQTRPSYAPQPGRPGIAGVVVNERGIELPRIEFFWLKTPELVITKGYQANFKGQYEVAEKVLDLYEDMGVKRIIVLAGYGRGEEGVSCAVTHPRMMDEMKRHGLEGGYEGPFYGLSGLVFGLGKLRGMEGLSLFSKTEPNIEDPEDPDPEAAKAVLKKLDLILNLKIDLSNL